MDEKVTIEEQLEEILNSKLDIKMAMKRFIQTMEKLLLLFYKDAHWNLHKHNFRQLQNA